MTWTKTRKMRICSSPSRFFDFPQFIMKLQKVGQKELLCSEKCFCITLFNYRCPHSLASANSIVVWGRQWDWVNSHCSILFADQTFKKRNFVALFLQIYDFWTLIFNIVMLDVSLRSTLSGQIGKIESAVTWIDSE